MTEDDDSAHRERLNAAGLIIADAIADALDRVHLEVPGLTIEETADVFEKAVEVIRHSEGWPEPEALRTGCRK
jgi:hypothetical protein